MVMPIEKKIMESIEFAERAYYRLVLIVGKSDSGKTAVLRKTAEADGNAIINVNMRVSEEFLGLSIKQRQFNLSKIMTNITKCKGDKIFLDNIEILFDTNLNQNPLRLLQGLSRNKTVVSTWNGSVMGDILTYGESDHREYRKYKLQDIVAVCIDGKAQ
jgi:hypothetical protein